MAFNLTFYEVFEELRFIIELVSAELLFAFFCFKRRQGFPVRFVLGLAILLLWSFFWFPWKEYLTSSPLVSNTALLMSGIILHYSFLTLLSIFFLYVCFDCSFSQTILGGIGAYCLQHLSYVVFTEIIARTWAVSIIEMMPLYIAVSILGFALFTGIFYFVFIRKFRSLEMVRLGRESISIVFYFFMLLATILLTFAGQAIYQNNATTRVVENPNYLGATVSFSTCTLVMLALYLVYYENQKQKETDIVSSLLYEQAKQYELRKGEIESIKRLSHDMKHKLLELKSSQNQSSEIIDEMVQGMDGASVLIDTGNEAVNIVLMDKGMTGRDKGINIEFDGDAGELSFMQPSDIYVFLGNALDNAIEAILRGDVKDKSILFSIKTTKGVASVQITNYYDGKVEQSNGAIRTRKKDSDFHGIGLRSIRNIVEKYQGILEVFPEETLFTLKAVFIRR